MMKQRLFYMVLLVVCFVMPVSVSALYEGEVVGTMYHSAIETYINNHPIRAYNMNDRQVICAEDLIYYGFSVSYYNEQRALYIEPVYHLDSVPGMDGVRHHYNLDYKRAYDVVYTDIKVYLGGKEIEAYSIGGRCMIKLRELEMYGRCEYNHDEKWSKAWVDGLPVGEYRPLEADYEKKLTVVLDAGHGKSSWAMSTEEKLREGYSQRNGAWGEWRHWKNGTCDQNCEGWGCRGDKSCWYGITAGDRTTEPDINLNNAYAAKKYLEEMGYSVRMTRISGEDNPAFSKRVAYCYPHQDMTAEPDAACYICIHSNAGGGRGSAYIAAEGSYRQKWINSSYTQNCNLLGQKVNDKIVAESSLIKHGNGRISGLGYMILFNKCPVPAGYLEIGFFDSAADLAILRAESDRIGYAIACGVNDYMKGW